VVEEVGKSGGRPRTNREIHLRRKAAAVDLRHRHAAFRATETSPHKHDIDGIPVGDPPMLHTRHTRLRPSGLTRFAESRFARCHRATSGGADSYRDEQHG